MKLSGGDDARGLFWRHLFVAPGLLIVWAAGGPWWLFSLAPLVAYLFASSYVISKEILWPQQYVWLAELVIGGLWGMMILVSA